MNTHTPKIQRRDFLKLLGAGIVSAMVVPASPVGADKLFTLLDTDPLVHFGKVLLRGTATGQIQKSENGGATWQTTAFFGEHCAVTDFKVKGEWLYATLNVGGHPFSLKTADAMNWRTPE